MAASAELARSTRSGVVESRHDGDAAVVSADGEIVATWGDPTQPVLYRSAIKPFQATVSQRHGAALVPEQMAVACSSHEAGPVHVALIGDMLEQVGLSEHDLATPPTPARITGRSPQLDGRTPPRSIFHWCSGKHTGFLRACVASGWPTSTYLDPRHPLQRDVLVMIEDVTAEPVEPVAVDGCGAPAPAGTVLGLARSFASLSIEPRFADARTAMTRYPALLSGNHLPDARIGAWWGGPVKRGAQGLIAAGRHGIGAAVKSRDGSDEVAAAVLVSLLDRIGLLADAQRDALAAVASPPVYGGGRPVGSLEPLLGT